jgi:hypothetical protein
VPEDNDDLREHAAQLETRRDVGEAESPVAVVVPQVRGAPGAMLPDEGRRDKEGAVLVSEGGFAMKGRQ